MAKSAFNQSLKPFRRGEDVAYTLTGTIDYDPTSWAVQFTLIPVTGDAVQVNSPTITRVVTNNGDGTYTAVFTIPLAHADTVGLATGDAGWQFERTDSGSYWDLGDGTLEILEPKNEMGP